MIVPLNEESFLFQFSSPEEARYVLEKGRRWFKEGTLGLEWWSPGSGCVPKEDLGKHLWMRMVGLPLHLWNWDSFRSIGDACGDSWRLIEIQH